MCFLQELHWLEPAFSSLIHCSEMKLFFSLDSYCYAQSKAIFLLVYKGISFYLRNCLIIIKHYPLLEEKHISCTSVAITAGFPLRDRNMTKVALRLQLCCANQESDLYLDESLKIKRVNKEQPKVGRWIMGIIQIIQRMSTMTK